MCVLFCFGFINNNIYNMASGSFVFICYWGPGDWAGVTMASRGCKCLMAGRPLFVWLEPTQLGSPPQVSVLTSKQMAALPSLLFYPRGSGQAKWPP